MSESERVNAGHLNRIVAAIRNKMACEHVKKNGWSKRNLSAPDGVSISKMMDSGW